MFELFFIFWLCCSLIFIFPLFFNPISMAMMVIIMSLCLVFLISTFSGLWFCYILFLVYVGGLLVMFIYICLVSSNYSFNINFSGLFLSLMSSFMFSLFGDGCLNRSYVMSNSWMSGYELMETANLGMFIFLGVFLFLGLLLIVRVSGSGSFIVSDEKN